MVTKNGSEVGAYWNNEKNNILNLLISTQKLYFGDNDLLLIKFMKYRYGVVQFFSLNVCGYKNWIGGLGVCELCKNIILSLLILIQKLYFGDNDAIYDVIIQEPV